MQDKNIIRITENDLKDIINESVRMVLNESYYVPTHSYTCLSFLAKKYDFINYDYGDEMVNNYVREENYRVFSIKGYGHKGYSDWATFSFANTFEGTLWHYSFNDGRSGFQLKVGDKKFRYIEDKPTKEDININEKNYADYLFSIMKPDYMVKKVAPIILDRAEAKARKKAEADAEDLRRNPSRWSPEERIKEWIECEYYLKTSYDNMSDVGSVYNRYHNIMDFCSKIEKAMSSEELEMAKKEFEKQYGNIE